MGMGTDGYGYGYPKIYLWVTHVEHYPQVGAWRCSHHCRVKSITITTSSSTIEKKRKEKNIPGLEAVCISSAFHHGSYQPCGGGGDLRLVVAIVEHSGFWVELTFASIASDIVEKDRSHVIGQHQHVTLLVRDLVDSFFWDSKLERVWLLPPHHIIINMKVSS